MFGAKADGAAIGGAFLQKDEVEIKVYKDLFTVADKGKQIFINGAGKNGRTLISTIVGVLNNKTVRIADKALFTVTNAPLTYGTDCTEAFISLNKKARGYNGRIIQIACSKGIYLTHFNNWLAGIRNVTIEGNNGSIICTNGAYDPDGFTATNNTLYFPSVFDNVDNHYYSTPGGTSYASNTSYGYLIKTTQAGAHFLSLKEADSAVHFNQGDWVLIGGFEGENTGGFPPLYRYFEYAQIKSVNAKQGTIFFTSPLKNSYDEEWPDNTWKNGAGGRGAPRILNCNRPNFSIIEHIIIRNLNFLPFSGWDGKLAASNRNGRVAFYGFLNGKFVNVSMNSVYVGTCRKAVFTNCIAKEYFEPDKEVDTLTIDNCKIKDFVLGPGINTENLIHSQFTGRFSASPRKLFAKDNIFETTSWGSTQGLINPGGNSGTDEVILEANIFRFTAPKSSIIAGGGFTKLRVDSVISNTIVLVSFNSWSDANNGRQVVPGKIGISGDSNQLLVKRVFKFSPRYIAVEGIFSLPPKKKDTFVFSYLPLVVIKNKQTKTGNFNRGKTQLFLDRKNIQQADINDQLIF